ncbi:MAG: hypothetical protein DRH11_10390, partial [Deltaproteobacteria bacterium]
MKKLSIIAILVIFCAVFGFAKVNTAKAVQPIRLGLLLPYTGVWAWVGAGADPGAELAVQEINADPALWPIHSPIKLYKEDTETKSAPAIAGARKLYDIDKVCGIVGPTSATVR